MIFKIETISDDFLEKACEEGMKDLNDFYGIDWVHHLPNIFIVKDRKQIDELRHEKTSGWVVGWCDRNRSIYLLDRDNFEKESEHKYKTETYKARLKHELSHAFYKIVSSGICKPIWLIEGVAIYTSGQNVFKKVPSEFKNFLEFYEGDGGGDVYTESGFAVQLLVEKFGKEKLLDLVKATKTINSKEDFDKKFKEIYEFEPTYEEFNKLYKLKMTN